MEELLSGALSVAWSVLAAITEYHRLGVLKQQTFIPHSSGGWEPGVGGAAWSSSGKDSLPGLQMAPFLLCPRVAEREITSLVFLFIRARIPFMRNLPS